MSNQPEIIEIDTHFIRTDGGTQTRAALNAFTLDEYYQAMERGAQFPPIDVYYDGSEYWLADGFHRLAAVEKMQNEAIECRVHQGDRRAAILHSVGANAQHGLQRSRDDVNRAIAMMLRDSEWQQWSDSAIANKVGCSNKTVAARRGEMVAAGEIEDSGIRKDANGRLMNTSKIGDGPSDAPTASMLDASPSMHPSIPADDELAAIGPAPTANPAPKAIPSIVNFQPAPTRTESQPRPESAPALLAAAVKANPVSTPTPPPLPVLTPAAPTALPTLTPVAAPVQNNGLQSVVQTQAIVALIQAMAVEAQRIAHETLTKYEQETKHYIEIEVDQSRFENAGKLMVTSPSIQSQAAFLAVAITVEDA